eukprot:COSAG06_NODE_15180_length_1091_cov_14.548387_1_plen_171_part_00
MRARDEARGAGTSTSRADYTAVVGPVHAQPGQPVDMKSDFAPAKIALAAGATGSGRGTTRWCCARPRCCPSTGAPATEISLCPRRVSRSSRPPPGDRGSSPRTGAPHAWLRSGERRRELALQLERSSWTCSRPWCARRTAAVPGGVDGRLVACCHSPVSILEGPALALLS